MAKKQATIEFYKNKSTKQHRFRIISANSNNIENPGEGYERIDGAFTNIVALAKILIKGKFETKGLTAKQEKKLRGLLSVIHS